MFVEMSFGEFLKYLEKAYPIYEECIEENGMCGDYEYCKALEKELSCLKKLVNAMREQIDVHQVINTVNGSVWLSKPENVKVREIVFYALDMIQTDLSNKKKDIEKELEVCNAFIDNRKNIFGGNKV